MSIVVSPKHLIEHEILSVTSSMRKNSRWATPNRLLSARDTTLARSMGLRQSGMLDTLRTHDREDVELMAGFEELKREIRHYDGEFWIYLIELQCPYLASRQQRALAAYSPCTLPCINSFFSFNRPYNLGRPNVAAHLLRVWYYTPCLA